MTTTENKFSGITVNGLPLQKFFSNCYPVPDVDTTEETSKKNFYHKPSKKYQVKGKNGKVKQLTEEEIMKEYGGNSMGPKSLPEMIIYTMMENKKVEAMTSSELMTKTQKLFKTEFKKSTYLTSLHKVYRALNHIGNIHKAGEYISRYRDDNREFTYKLRTIFKNKTYRKLMDLYEIGLKKYNLSKKAVSIETEPEVKSETTNKPEDKGISDGVMELVKKFLNKEIDPVEQIQPQVGRVESSDQNINVNITFRILLGRD